MIIAGTSQSTEVFVLLGVVVIAACVWLYARALSAAKLGRLVVFASWSDFLCSCLWIITAPIGVMWMYDGNGMLLVGMIVVVLAIGSFVSFVIGAFRYNSGGMILLSLYARFAVLLLIVFLLGKANDSFQKNKEKNLEGMIAVAIPLVICGAVFRLLIRPMIGRNFADGQQHPLQTTQ